MDFKKADEVAETFIRSLLKNNTQKEGKGHVYKRLFGTNTTDGSINVVEELIKDINHRIFIKGRAGTGKSVFMRKVLEACLKYNFNVELYYCSFDPKSIDMVIIRALNCCLFDSTPPHEFFPQYEYDKVIDLYEVAVEKGTDERFKDEIERVTNKYKERMEMGLRELRKLKKVYEEEKERKSLLSRSDIEHTVKKLLNVIH